MNSQKSKIIKQSREVLDDFLLKVCELGSSETILRDLQRLQILSHDFEERYLNFNKEKSFTDIQLLEETGSYHVAYLSSEDSCPYRIELVKEDFWQIRSFKFLCMGCLGEDPTCMVCGGGGWGVL